MNSSEVQDLIQTGYFDGVDAGDGKTACRVMHPDVLWTHLPSWKHDDVGLSHTAVDVVRGRKELETYFTRALVGASAAGLRHTIDETVFDGRNGMFTATTTSTKNAASERFMVWFRMVDDLVATYHMRPL